MDDKKKIRWLMIDDQNSAIETYTKLLRDADPGLEHAFPAVKDEETALARLAEDPTIDVVLLDINIRAKPTDGLKDTSRAVGWHCAAQISFRFPNVRIILVSQSEPDPSSSTDQLGLFEMGGLTNISAYIPKETSLSFSEIAKIIREVVTEGSTRFPGDILKKLLEAHDRGKISAKNRSDGFRFGDPCAQYLTRTLHDFMLDVAAGYSHKEIAEHLHISPKTVEKYVDRCCDLLDITPNNKLALSKWAHENCLELQKAKERK